MGSLKNECKVKVQTELLKRRFKVISSDFPNENYYELNNEAPDFHKLRDNLLENNSLFEDPDFAATDDSLSYTDRFRKNYKWLRPKEILSDPEFVIDGVSRFDIRQGKLGDCWFLAALATLTTNKTVFDWIIPRDQGFKDKYAGIFYFKFWQYGRWVEVVIDDRLPTTEGQLLFTTSQNQKEFWSALLEKAYAKLHGSYEALRSGMGSEALEDFTGGLSESYRLSPANAAMFLRIIPKYYEMQALMTCNVPDASKPETKNINGLISGHEYSITGIKSVVKDDNRLLLIRIRNPWGEMEWKGAWSDRSSEWEMLPEKERMNVISDDGEFWISLDDFIKEFDYLKMCHLHPKVMKKLINDNKWKIIVAEGEWVRGVSAGGKKKSNDLFYHNPQFVFNLEKTNNNSENCGVIISLMQNYTRAMIQIGKEWLSLSFNLYQIGNRNPSLKLNEETILKCKKIQISAMNVRRAVTCRVDLQPGTYCIIPCDGTPNTEGEFLLRIGSENIVDLRALEEEQNVKQYNETDSTTNDIIEETMNKDNQEFHEFLKKFDAEVNANELKEIFNYVMKIENNKFNEFTLDACSDIIDALNDESRTFNISQFGEIWSDIKFLLHVFEFHQENNSGFLKPFSFKAALNAAGFKIDERVLNLLAYRYATTDGKVAFDNFIACSIRLRLITKKLNEDSEDTISIAKKLENYFKHYLCDQ